jgi:hypothetical protein
VPTSAKSGRQINTRKKETATAPHFRRCCERTVVCHAPELTLPELTLPDLKMKEKML